MNIFKRLMVIVILLISIFVINGLDVSALEVSSSNSKITTYSNEPSKVTFTTGQDIQIISLISESTAYYSYKVSGLDPNKVYGVLVDLKVENVTGKGAVIGTHNIEYNSITYGYSGNLTGTTDWITVGVTAVPLSNGTLEIVAGFCYGSELSKGTVKIRNVVIKEAKDFTNLIIRESKNNRIKMVLLEDDFKKAGITESQLQTYLNLLEEVCYSMEELTGNSKYGMLYPNKRKQIVYLMTNYHEYGALAGYPIHVNAGYTVELLRTAKTKNKISWTFLHEMGHLFDWPLSTVSGSYTTSNDRFSRESEQTASFYPLYAMYKLNLTTDNNENFITFLNNRKKYYDEYITKGKFYGDGYNYLLSMVQKNGVIDWEAFKKTYKWFNDLDNDYYEKNINRSLYHRTVYFFKKLDDYSDYDVSSLIAKNDSAFAILGSKLTYVKVDITNEQSLLSDKKVNIKTNPTFANDVIVYNSSNKNILTIEDYGNIAVKDNSYGEVTITVSSYLNSTVSASVKVNIEPPAKLENKDEVENNNEDKDIIIDDEVIVKKDDKINNKQSFNYIEVIQYIIISVIIVLVIIMIFRKKH